MVAVDLMLLAGGVVFLVGGAALVVEAGSAIARRMGISPVWVGLTVVAVGTSAPELVVSVLASAEGAGTLAVGNVVGSNILNVLVVLGVTAAVRAVPVGGVVMRRDMGLVAALGIAVLALSADGTIHRGEGLLLLAGVLPYTWYVYRAERRGAVPAPELPQAFDRFPVAIQAGLLAVGFGALAAGGWAVVEAATSLTLALGIPERIVGLTIVAVGTSLPELATSLMAALRGRVDLAVGNIAGSNLMNLLLVLGGAASVAHLPVEQSILWLDMPVMVAASLLLLRFAATQARVSRIEGGVLLACYFGYATLLARGAF